MNQKTYFLVTFAAILVILTVVNLAFLKFSITLIKANKQGQESERNVIDGVSNLEIISLRKRKDDKDEVHLESGAEHMKHSETHIPPVSAKDSEKKVEITELKHHGKKHQKESKHEEHEEKENKEDKDKVGSTSQDETKEGGHMGNNTPTNVDVDGHPTNVPTNVDGHPTNVPTNVDANPTNVDANPTPTTTPSPTTPIDTPPTAPTIEPAPFNPVIPPLTPDTTPTPNTHKHKAKWDDEAIHKKDDEYHTNHNLHNHIDDQNPLYSGPSDNPLSKMQLSSKLETLNEETSKRVTENNQIELNQESRIDSDLKVGSLNTTIPIIKKKQGKIIEEINTGNLKGIVSLLVGLSLLALCVGVYEQNENLKTKEKLAENNYRLFEGEDYLLQDDNTPGIRDL